MAATGAVRKFFHDDKKEFDPRKWLAVSTKAMKQICKERYESFGTAGNASKIKVDIARCHGQALRQGRARSEGELRLSQHPRRRRQVVGRCSCFDACI